MRILAGQLYHFPGLAGPWVTPGKTYKPIQQNPSEDIDEKGGARYLPRRFFVSAVNRWRPGADE